MQQIILTKKRADGLELQKFLLGQPDLPKEILAIEKSDLESEVKKFTDVKYIFSTWDMPIFTTKEVKKYFPSLEIIFYAAGQINYFADSFQELGIKIITAQVENSIPVAEFVVAQVLLANKGYFLAERVYRRGLWRWSYKKARNLSRDRIGNFNAKVGIIGYGSVGSLVASKLQNFDLDILVSDPLVTEESMVNKSLRKVDLHTLFSECDVISNHLPDTSKTREILNYDLFSKMKKESTFINTGRGRQVNQGGLIKALREFPTRSALLDVSAREPALPFSPLYRMSNVFLSPHIAGSQGLEVHRMYEAILNKYRAYRMGEL